jgi:hypothetical protein
MRSFWTPFLVALLLSTSLVGKPSSAADSERISGPFVHENLAIYLVHGNSSTGPVPLTFEEALATKTAKITETGEVNSLDIENVGAEPIFVQSGDIVKGGQQDRALTASLLIPPHSGRTRIAVFCVEHGRWSGREGEDATTFSSALTALPSREAKIAIKTPAPTPAEADTSRRQFQLWNTIAKIQQSLSNSLGAPVASPRSRTSLQLSLESEALVKAEAEYLSDLQAVAEKDTDIIGYAFAVNGKLSTADIYPSNGLFRKMWPKLVKSAAVEAIAARTANAAEPAPSTYAVGSFLKSAERGTKANQDVAAGVKVETRDSAKVLYFETKSASPAAPAAAFIHRNYLAK